MISSKRDSLERAFDDFFGLCRRGITPQMYHEVLWDVAQQRWPNFQPSKSAVIIIDCTIDPTPLWEQVQCLTDDGDVILTYIGSLPLGFYMAYDKIFDILRIIPVRRGAAATRVRYNFAYCQKELGSLACGMSWARIKFKQRMIPVISMARRTPGLRAVWIDQNRDEATVLGLDIEAL